MVEDVSKYKFEFVDEVEELREYLGEDNIGILFVESSIDSLRKDSPVEIRHVLGRAYLSNFIPENIKQQYEKELSSGYSPTSSQGWRTRDGLLAAFVATQQDEPFINMFGEENKQLLRLFTLYHETAHVFLPGPQIDEDHPYREAAADAYAAQCMLKRFGKDIIPLLSMISWSRAFDALNKKTKHLSTTVLDKIILDSADEDYFSGLTHRQMTERAEEYAKALTPEASVISETRKTFGRARDACAHVTDLLAKTCLSSPLDELSEYLFFRAAEPFFLKPGDLVYLGEVWPCKYPEQLEQVRMHIAERAPAMDLRRIFNIEAGKDPPAAPPKITLPRGQTQFVYKP